MRNQSSNIKANLIITSRNANKQNVISILPRSSRDLVISSCIRTMSSPEIQQLAMPNKWVLRRLWLKAVSRTLIMISVIMEKISNSKLRNSKWDRQNKWTRAIISSHYRLKIWCLISITKKIHPKNWHLLVSKKKKTGKNKNNRVENSFTA